MIPKEMLILNYGMKNHAERGIEVIQEYIRLITRDKSQASVSAASC